MKCPDCGRDIELRGTGCACDEVEDNKIKIGDLHVGQLVRLEDGRRGKILILNGDSNLVWYIGSDFYNGQGGFSSKGLPLSDIAALETIGKPYRSENGE